MSTTSVVFMGNPGVGKSALLNSLGGNFESGLSEVGGLTKNVSSISVFTDGRNLELFDVPGIMESGTDDVISENLKKLQDTLETCGTAVLFIVVTPRNGRISSDDFAIMKTLLSKLHQSPQIGIIITQVKKRQMHTMQSHDYFNKLLDTLKEAEVDLKFVEQYRWLVLEDHDDDFSASDLREIRNYVFSFTPVTVQFKGNLFVQAYRAFVAFFKILFG